MLADGTSHHTCKWVNAMSEQGFEICLFTLNPTSVEFYDPSKNITLINGKGSGNLMKQKGSNFLKMWYLRNYFQVLATIKKFNPDILHSHYASSYGLLGSLSGFEPFLISVWGSDVYEFPRKSFIHRRILSFNLKNANLILSASRALATETGKYTRTPVTIIPFGIDTDTFKPLVTASDWDQNEIVIGTIKSLEKVYGIDYLIKAFHLVRQKQPGIPLRLLIAGDGSEEKNLRNLVKELNLDPVVTFAGRIPFEKLPEYHNRITIFAALSLSESFGVAILEASACGKPVVVTHVGGLPEVVVNNSTGLIVPVANEKIAAESLEKLILDKALRDELGRNGRQRVISSFNWKDNVLEMAKIYDSIIAKTNNRK